MKIGLIADPHANLSGVRTALQALIGCDILLCAGDLTGYFPFVNETIDLLRAEHVLCVRGNHDEFVFGKPHGSEPRIAKSVPFMLKTLRTDNTAYLQRLPYQLELILDGKKILMCHGSPWNLLDEYVYPDREQFEDFARVDADIIVLGHTHIPMVKHAASKLIVNPGSCGQPRNQTRNAGAAILNTTTLNVELLQIPFALDVACEAALAAGLEYPYRMGLSVTSVQ